MKDSGVDWIGKIPEDWGIKKIGNYFNQVKNKNHELREQNLLSLSYGKIIRKDIKTTEGLLPENFSSYNIVRENDIVLRMTDLQNDKKSLRTGLVTETGIITSAYITLRSKNNALNIVNSKFIHYQLYAFDIIKGFYGMGSGVRQNINIDDIKTINIALPNYQKQQQIINFLDNALEKIETIISDTQQSVEELKKYKRSLITEIVTRGLDKNVKMKDSGVEWIVQTPVNWNVIRVKYILSEKNKKSVTGEEEPLSMSQKFGLIPSKDMDNIPNAPASYIGNKQVGVNDLVFNKLKAHLGVFAVSNYNGIVSPDYAVYQAKKYIDVKYLEFLFKTPQAIAEFIKYSRGVGAGLTRLYTYEFFNIKVSLPDLEEQKKIVEYLNKVSNAIDSLIIEKQKIIEEYEQYKKSLTYEYITGKKEV